MEGTGREVDLAGSKPGYRARICNPLKALGTRRLLPRVHRPGRPRPVLVAHETDLTRGTEGQPGPRADVAWINIAAYVRYGDAEAGVTLSGPPEAPQGIAITAVLLVGAGVLFACGALAAGFFFGLPLIPVAVFTVLVAAAPSFFYFLMRRR